MGRLSSLGFCVIFSVVYLFALPDSLKTPAASDSIKADKPAKRKPVIKMPSKSSRKWVQQVLENKKARERADSVQAYAQDTTKSPYEIFAARKKEVMPLLIMRPVSQYGKSKLKNKWLLRLCETYVHFKLGGVPALHIISPDTLASLMFPYKEYKRAIPTSDYQDAARKLSVPYMLYLECKDISIFRGGGTVVGKNVNLLGTLSSAYGEETIATIPMQCSSKELGKVLDQFVLQIVEKLGIPQEKQNRPFLETTLLGDNKNIVKKLGDMLVSETTVSKKEFQNFLKEYNTLLSKYTQMIVGYYAGVQFCVARKLYAPAADFSYALVHRLGHQYPTGYLMAAVNYRMVKNYDEAIRIAKRAEDIESLRDTLMREKALCYAAETGHTKDATALYNKILKKDNTNTDALLYFARTYNNEGNASKALSFANRLLKVASTHQQGLIEKAKSLITLKKYTEALQYLNKALSAVKPDPYAHVLTGDIYKRQKKYTKAIDTYKEYLSLKPKDDAVLLTLAQLQKDIKKNRDAVESYKKLFKLNKDKYKEQMITAGMLLEKENDPLGAKAVYIKFLDAGLHDNRVSLRLARIEFKEQGHNRTAELLSKVTKSALTAEHKKMLGISYYKTGKEELALPNLEAAYKKYPNDTQIIEMLAVLYEKKNKYKKALALYTKFLSLSKGKHPVYAYKIGLLYEKQNQIKTAMAQYNKNIKKYPKAVKNYEALGRLYMRQKNSTAALKILMKAASLPNATPQTTKMLGQLAMKSKKPALAIQYYTTYLAESSGDTLVWRDLADIYFSNDKLTSQAVGAAENAGTLITGNPKYHFKLGSAYHQLDNCEKAVIYLEKFREENVEDKKTLQLLADCYKALNNEWKLNGVMNVLSTLESPEEKKKSDKK